MAAENPVEYFKHKLASSGLQPSPGFRLRCASLVGQTQGKDPAQLPHLYDKSLLSTLLQGSEAEVQALICNIRLANAQSHTGETILMKSCRHVVSEEGASKLWLIEHLLDCGADPLVCCDSSKNVLHDLFWSAVPPPAAVLYAMEHVLHQLLESVGRSGVLLLMCSTDRFGFTPADYIKPENQSNWKRLVDNMFAWGSAPANGESDGPAALAHPAAFPVTILPGSATCDEIYQVLHSDHVSLLKRLDELGASFLLSDMNDPNAIIVAASKAFCTVTGYELSEVLGQNCRLLQGPETDYRTVQQIRKALREATPLHVNILNYRKDKTKFQNNFMLIPLTSGSKNFYYVGIQDCPEEISNAWNISPTLEPQHA